MTTNATVWSSTWVPAASPIEGFGADGYAVCWADVDGVRVQVLVDGDPPAPGAAGRIETRTSGGTDVQVFLEVRP